MIRHTSFKHGWFYHYRHHTEKSSQLCSDKFLPLKDYLDEMHDRCPDEHFIKGPRSSKLRMSLGIDTVHVTGHEISSIASVSHEHLSYKSAHSRVQVYMLENDQTTLAVEVPIWLMPDELIGFNELFDSDEPLSGHIDALRVEDGKIWIWDYKPNAKKEKYATTQVFFYAYMLSCRTKIPLSDFRCGYFDEEHTYMFKPELGQLVGCVR